MFSTLCFTFCTFQDVHHTLSLSRNDVELAFSLVLSYYGVSGHQIHRRWCIPVESRL